MLRASGRLWSAYEIEKEQDSSTNYSNVNVASLSRDEERHLRSAIDDDEFIKTYLDVVISAHNQVVNKLYTALNTNHNTTRVHFKAFEAHKLDFSSKKVASGDTHLFRTFRVIGLRKQKQPTNLTKSTSSSSAASKRNNHHVSFSRHHQNSSSFIRNNNTKSLANFLVQNDFNDVVDIRAAFDIKQFHNRTGYDCFIECEFNYFRIYHHMCNHVHYNWHSNEFSESSIYNNHHYHRFPTARVLNQQTGESSHHQKTSTRLVSPPPPSKHEDSNTRSVNSSRRKAERLIASHLNTQPVSNTAAHSVNINNRVDRLGSFSQSFGLQQPTSSQPSHQISMRMTTTSNRPARLNNDVFVGTQFNHNNYHNTNNTNDVDSPGRHLRTSFYFTRNRDENM